MKIGFLLYGDPDKISGGNIYDSEIIHVLKSLGHTVRIFSLDRYSYYRNMQTNYTGTIQQELLSYGPDILLEDELTHPSLFRLNRKIRNRFRIPVVSIIHNLTAFSSEHPVFPVLSQIIERMYLRTLDGIIAVSGQTLEHVNRFSDPDIPELVSYPAGNRFNTGYAAEQILQRVHKSGPFQILFPANITPNKQLDVLLKSLHTLNDFTCQVTVLGRLDISPGYVKHCNNLIRQFALEELVHLAGPIREPAELERLFSRSHVMVLPSKSEGFPLVLPEAAGFGVPAIITNMSAAGEFIRQGENGFLIDPNDVKEISQILQMLNNNRTILEKMSTAALQRYRTHPTWAKTGEYISDFLLRLIGVKVND